MDIVSSEDSYVAIRLKKNKLKKNWNMSTLRKFIPGSDMSKKSMCTVVISSHYSVVETGRRFSFATNYMKVLPILVISYTVVIFLLRINSFQFGTVNLLRIIWIGSCKVYLCIIWSIFVVPISLLFLLSQFQFSSILTFSLEIFFF